MRNFIPYLLFLLPIVVFLRIDFYFTVVYFLAVVYLLSRVWTRRTVGSLAVERRFVDRAFTGDEVQVELVVRNTGVLPVPWLEVKESLPLELSRAPFALRVITLGPREEWCHAYTLTCRRRGYHQIGPLRMGSGDLLGFQPRVSAVVSAKRMTVYPRVVALHELGLPTNSPLVALPARSPLFEDASRLMGVRDYQRGDSPRRIHWPATARTGQLVVKQYQPAIARETLICLDLDTASYERRRFEATELAIVAAASIASHIIVREGLPVGLSTEAMDPLPGERRHIYVPPGAERAHLKLNILEPLARVQVTSGASLLERIRQDSVNLSWGSTMVLITGNAGEELLSTLAYLRRRGYALSLLLVQPVELSAELRGQARAIDVPVHRVWTERDLETWR